MKLNCSVKSLFFDTNLILRTERTLQQKQTLVIMDKLKKELDAAQQVNDFLALQWRELKTSENLAEMTGLGKDMGTDVAIIQIASEFIDLKKENEKLKKELAQPKHQTWTDKHIVWVREVQSEVKELQEENKKLKEQNATLLRHRKRELRRNNPKKRKI